MSAFLAMSMAVQTLYLLADLYWVGHLGKEAIAAVGVAGNITMIVLALTQMLGVGTTTLIAQAAGRKDQVRAELVFNQSFVMSIVIAFALGIVGFLLRPAYCDWLSADAATATLAKAYLLWFLPGLLLQFPLVALGSALRATGIIKPAVGFQVLSVLLNIVLAPLLIFGIGPWPKLGVTGAALATFISILVADVLMVIYFEKKYHYLRFRFPLFRPRTKIWSGMLRIGVPAGAEFMLLFVYILLVYAIIRGFGPAAQAGFGIGARVMQALFLPVVALSFAASPVVGQNFGGRRAGRVRQSVYSAMGIASLMMLVLTLIAFFAPGTLIRTFSRDPRQTYLYVADAMNMKVHILDRQSLEELTSFGDGGRQPGGFYAVRNVATDSKGNVYTGETYEGKRVQKFIYKGVAAVTTKDRASVWPRSPGAGGKP